ncbi:MAG: DNA polymerase III subunit epsilon [Oceanospirillaceae bacterium]|nr:DNA polymerase III subunit epsilon [Oceanospirillaceae bacterium]
MRQIILDTETTGLEPSQGHNVIEIGCVEMIKRRLTGNNYHQYIKPDRDSDEDAIRIHGITNEFLADKPKFRDITADFLEYIRGAELIIHNAPFDIGFLNAELKRNGCNEKVEDICSIVDSLALARRKHPGQKNNLNALCRRYGIDNSHRELHGALLDSEILADVYLMITGGQTNLLLAEEGESGSEDGTIAVLKLTAIADQLKVISPTTDELQSHVEFVAMLDKKTGGESLYTTLNTVES